MKCSQARTREIWQERMRRFGASSLTVVEFCRLEGVSTPSFYSWRHKLANTSAKPLAAVNSPAAFHQLSISLAASPVRIELLGGTRIEIPSDRLELARAIVAEVVRLEKGVDENGAGC